MQLGRFLEEPLRDRLVCGMNNGGIQKKLLSENDLTPQRAIDIATAVEMAVLQLSDQLAQQHKTEVLAIRQICKCCGKREHSQRECRFRTQVCYQCGEKGHLRMVCQVDKPPSVKQVKEQQVSEDKSDNNRRSQTRLPCETAD